jgi:hypothetical protein
MRQLQEIKESLGQPIPPDVVHPADPDRGIFGSYITAQYAMQKANEILGVDGITEIEILKEERIEQLKPKVPFGDWVFITTVKMHFRCFDEEEVVEFSRVGIGVGVAHAPYNTRSQEHEPVKPQQLDTAVKSSLSDAIKNALMRTGRSLGAELYMDERQAQALGYENFSGRAAAQSEAEDPTDLSEHVCKWGWGSKKKFKGMSLAEIYADDDGHSSMEWAAKLDEPEGFTAKMKKYFLLRQAEDEEGGQGGDEGGAPPSDMVQMWYGDAKPANELVDWPAIKKSPGFVTLIAEKMNPDGEIPNFGPEHPRFKNHLKRHFHIDSGEMMTWNILQALHVYCKEGSQAVGFGWPNYYTGDRAPTEKSLEQEAETEPEEEDSDMVIGPARNQKLPSSLQVLAKEAGAENPDEWLWGVIREPVGEWTSAHTELMVKIIDAVKSGNIPIDDGDMLHMFWEVGLKQSEE